MTASKRDKRNLDTLASADHTRGPAVNVSMMRLMHGRAPDGYIALERKLPDGSLDLKNRCFLPVADLREMLPGMVEHYSRDGYHSISVYFGAAPWENETTGLRAMATKAKRPTWARCKENLRYLPTCFTDLDCGRSEEKAKRPEETLSWRYVAAAAGDMMDRGELPQATIIARSGRGIYLFWLLCDEKNRRIVPRAHNFNVALMEAINRELNNRTLHLAADRGAFDATRLCRMDGSWHTGAQARVQYLEQTPLDIPRGYIQRDESGRHYIYTLEELAATLNIPTIPAVLTEHTQRLLEPGEKYKRDQENKPHGRETKNPGTNPRMVVFQQRLYAKRMIDLLALEQYRIRQTKGHGFLKRGMEYPDGFVASVCGRREVLTIYAECFKRTNEAQDKAVERVKAMAANCNPPYPSDSNDTPVEKIVRDVYDSAYIRKRGHDKLCKWLGITDALADELHLETLLPDELRARRKTEKPTRDNYTQARRKAIIDIQASDGKWRPPQKMANLLSAQAVPGARNPITGKAWSGEIIRQDYIALHLARRLLGRPTKGGERGETRETRTARRWRSSRTGQQRR